MVKKKVVLGVLMGLAIMVPFVYTAPSFAQGNASIYDEEPLKPAMIIRFNRSQVNYTRALHHLVSKAASIKSDVQFNVMMLASEKSRKTDHLMSNVKKELHNIGVPSTNIRMTFQEDISTPFPEIHIFAY